MSIAGVSIGVAAISRQEWMDDVNKANVMKLMEQQE
jgi:hypothetical protein